LLSQETFVGKFNYFFELLKHIRTIK
jgi:hypothetical protein